MPDGFPIVLTADRTLTARYRLLFDGMLAASQTTAAPPAIFGPLLMPQTYTDGLRAILAPLGLRRIEAALLDGGFTPAEVAVVAEDQLDQAIGPATRIIGVSTGEPTGLGMNSSTMTCVAGGKIYPEAMFRRLIDKVRLLQRRGSARIIAGGPGAWQLAADPRARQQLGIDHVLLGYAEANAADTFRQLLQEKTLPGVIDGGWRPEVPIPRIRGASTMGIVEASRGCGLGCSFCTIARVPMVHLPQETILADIETNLAAGQPNVAVLSEDFFRYGAQGMKVDPHAPIALLEAIRQIPQVRLIQIDHANVATLARYDDEQLARIHDLLVGEDRQRAVWVNVGVESASEELLRSAGAQGKIPRDTTLPWSEFCSQQIRRLCQAKFFPMASLVIGLPGEHDEHVQETLNWVQSLSDQRVAVFPVLYAPLDNTPPLNTRSLRPIHWQLIRACYRLNFRWIPWFYRDNQAAGGVPWIRRTALQCMGYGQVFQWQMLFAWYHWRSRR